MRVLVTGAGGFVGSNVVRCLARAGHQVMAADRSLERLDQLRIGVPTATTFPLDLADGQAVRSLFAGGAIDGLIHLAWYANPDDYLTSHANLPSLTMTTGLMEAALTSGCRRIVVGGSCAEYAPQTRLLRENDPTEARTLYAACKESAWQITRILAAEVDAALAWARIFHIHGPDEDPRRLIPWVARQMKQGMQVPLTDGRQIRDHLHVADVASGLVALVEQGASGIFNVCSGKPVTLRQVLETVAELIGNGNLLQFGARPHRAHESMFVAGDATRLRDLGWRPQFDLREGLADALRAYF